MAELEHFYTIIEAAHELNLSVPAVRSRVQYKTILSIKTPSKKILIPKEEVARLKQRCGDPDADVDAEIARLRQKV